MWPPTAARDGRTCWEYQPTLMPPPAFAATGTASENASARSRSVPRVLVIAAQSPARRRTAVSVRVDAAGRAPARVPLSRVVLHDHSHTAERVQRQRSLRWLA